MNTFFSSQYRSYNKSIPPYLHSRPRSLVLNCLEKRGIALSSDLTGITCQGKGSFSVSSFSNNVRESYEVHFGNENEMPKCSCLDWKKSSYLCKHFFAIFEKYPSWPFTTLSIYTIPFLNLDEDAIALIEQLPEINDNKRKGELEVGEILCNNDETIFEPLPRKKKFKSTKPVFFSEILKEIKDLSYLIHNDDVFSETLEHLFCIKKILQPSVPRERGLPLEPLKMGSKRKIFTPLPLPLCKKKAYSLVDMGKVLKTQGNIERLTELAKHP